MAKPKQTMGRLKLFDGQADDDGEELSKISINSEFAKRYEHNKKREELQRYEELKKQGRAGSDSDASSSEDDDVEEELVKPSKKRDFKFFDALLKVKNQDPVLREKDAKLFDSDSDESEEGEEKVDDDEKRKKPMYLKDVVSKHLIEAGPEFSDGEEEMENVGGERKGGVKSYSEEQEELRKEFLNAVEEGGNDDDGEGEEFLRVKDNGGKDEEEDDDVVEKLDEYFGEDEKLDEDTRFLKDYFRNKMWIDDGKGRSVGDGDGGDGGDGIEFSEDEEEIEKQEDYEREFNFRFEENAGDRVMGHSRRVEGSVRKKENARKSQRERKEERMLQAEFERKEELKRLKNLKKKEINEKLETIREAAGIGKDGDVLLEVDDLEEEFDPVEYDKKMKEAFGDRYYETEDPDPGFGSGDEDLIDEKPDFDKEDELLGLPKGWDEVDGSHDGFMSARQRILKGRVIDGDEIEAVEEDDNDGGDERKEGKRKRKRKPSEVEKAVKEQLMEEYYKLDYEDTIGDLKTRFKYKPVKANRYRLKAEDILTKDDKELNQIVSLKKLAPYREKEWKVHPNKIIELKQKSKVRDGETSGSGDKDRKKRRDDSKTDGSETNKLQNVKSNGDVNGLSRKSKRRRRQAELKLSRSRLDAYGKLTSKHKSKNQ